MKKDIQTRADIETLIRNFYLKVTNDETIGFIFNDVVNVDWEKHLPVMFDFWENILLKTGNYAGNPMPLHITLNEKVALKALHFNKWIQLFNETLDEYFEGDIALQARQRAQSIATIMQIKIAQVAK